MIVNFINWLNVVSFQDKNQDIIFLFVGTNEKEQGQGSGKGIIQSLFHKIFSGLVCSVSNQSYNKDFNSILMNKKVVVFDEINFQTLKYEYIKDITGSPLLTIEYKGKERIETNNVSSWLGFTNEYDLCNKITIEDRRTFIIRPNPINGSLKRIVEKNYNGDFNYFQKCLNSEINNFIHIISNVDGKVLTPLELVSQGHINYFKEQRKISILEISNIYKTFTNNNFKDKLFDILNTIQQIDINSKDELNNCKKIINLNTINYKIFKIIFTYLQQYDYIPTRTKCNVEWEILKEKLINYKYKRIVIDNKKTKLFNRYKDTNILLLENITQKGKNKIYRTYREVFGVRII